MKIRRSLPGIRKVFYHTVVFAMVTGIMIIANCVLFLGILLQYIEERTDYVSGEKILKAMTVTDEGYVLSESMQEGVRHGRWPVRHPDAQAGHRPG